VVLSLSRLPLRVRESVLSMRESALLVTLKCRGSLRVHGRSCEKSLWLIVTESKSVVPMHYSCIGTTDFDSVVGFGG
jgi:hypothetical protein